MPECFRQRFIDLDNLEFATMSRTTRFGWVLAFVWGAVLSGAGSLRAGTNLMAIGQYADVQYKRAEARESASGGELIYRFAEPGLDFGHIVIRSNQSLALTRRDLFVGFTGEGLSIDTRSSGGAGRAASVSEVEIWLRVQGKLRSEAQYEWDLEVFSGGQVLGGGLPAVIPFLWADGEPTGSSVDIRTPERRDGDEFAGISGPHGVVTLPSFDRQTGGAWVVLKPDGFTGDITLRRFSLREIDPPEVITGQRDMPIPVRYVPIRDPLESRITAALTRGAAALRTQRNAEGFWSGSDIEDSVNTTSLSVWALAEGGADATVTTKAMEWLAEQEPQAGQFWQTRTIANRLRALARHGGLKAYSRIIHSDISKLTIAQSQDGGWSVEGREEILRSSGLVRSDNLTSALVVASLREARMALANVDGRVWRRAMSYWTRAQGRDGGFREKLEHVGGISQPTTAAFTAYGAASLIAALDMSAGFGNRDCNRFLHSPRQLKAIERSLAWLDAHYKEKYRHLTSVDVGVDAYAEPEAFQWLGEASGLVFFNGKNHFSESAVELLSHFDPSVNMFGVRGADDAWTQRPSLTRTARALTILGSGAAPALGQRIIAGDDEKGWQQYRGDIAHLVRYLSAQRGRPFQWRRSSIDDDLRDLVKVPLMMLSVVGPFEWSDARWQKLADYTRAGGTVVVDLPEADQVVRRSVESALSRAFPDYELRKLPADAPVFTMETTIEDPPAVRAIGNGFREFVFVPEESWSCQWHLYQRSQHEASFAFMNNLLSYATDATPLRSSFVPSTYAPPSAPAYVMRAERLEIGGRTPAYPKLMESMDRLLQQNYRLGVVYGDDPADCELLWVSVIGPEPPSELQISRLEQTLKAGKFVLIDVVSGDAGWDESWRASLRRIEGVTLEKLPRTDPIYTGEIPGTQGFDVVNVAFRKALHTRFAKSGRCDLYSLRFHGKPAGVYSTYDLASGIGYQYFPKCRGVMPEHARQLAMNAFLLSYEWKVRRKGSD